MYCKLVPLVFFSFTCFVFLFLFTCPDWYGFSLLNIGMCSLASRSFSGPRTPAGNSLRNVSVLTNGFNVSNNQ